MPYRVEIRNPLSIPKQNANNFVGNLDIYFYNSDPHIDSFMLYTNSSSKDLVPIGPLSTNILFFRDYVASFNKPIIYKITPRSTEGELLTDETMELTYDLRDKQYAYTIMRTAKLMVNQAARGNAFLAEGKVPLSTGERALLFYNAPFAVKCLACYDPARPGFSYVDHTNDPEGTGVCNTCNGTGQLTPLHVYLEEDGKAPKMIFEERDRSMAFNKYGPVPSTTLTVYLTEVPLLYAKDIIVRKDPRHFDFQYFLCQQNAANAVMGGFIGYQAITLQEITGLDTSGQVLPKQLTDFLTANPNILS